MLRIVSEGAWIEPNYGNRLKMPTEWIQECWQLVDKNKLQRKLADRIEDELADRIVNNIAAELSTDIKQLLSVKERREKIRSLARDNIDSIMKAGTNNEST